jgi:putative aldouronate transport system permease protein
MESILHKGSARTYKIKEQIEIQSMVVPAIVFLFVFAYIPIYGLVTAFREYNIISGFGDWVGLRNFRQFLIDPNLINVMRNTLFINLLGLALGFPAPIILALLLNEIKFDKFKKAAQTVSYLPHFLSWTIFGGIMLELIAKNGAFNALLVSIGILDEGINFIGKNEYFYLIYVISSIIKTLGYGSILYVAAIAGVDQNLYEAAEIDGCGWLKKAWHITLPCILGTVVIMLIFQISAILNTGYEQLLIFQNPLNTAYSETIDTYVYKIGMQQQRFSYATAVGMLKSVISVILLLAANTASKKLTERGLF